ncbi:MAG: HD domain-containing protein [Bacteroidota bacterium]|nr:HD domain-containing protein [Bacteroidota bacterium]
MFLQKEIDFILAIDKLKNVSRRNFNTDDARRENTAEHSWQVMVVAQVLLPYAQHRNQIDLLRVLKMLSIHDIVEIEAGDTFVYDQEAMQNKYQRELQAAKAIFGKLDSAVGEEFLNLWIEFEAAESVDAKFASAVDRFIPFLLNSYTSGKSWTESSVTVDKVKEIVGPEVQTIAPEFIQLFDELIQKNVKEGKLIE